jgi:hypothetical protein
MTGRSGSPHEHGQRDLGVLDHGGDLVREPGLTERREEDLEVVDRLGVPVGVGPDVRHGLLDGDEVGGVEAGLEGDVAHTAVEVRRVYHAPGLRRRLNDGIPVSRDRRGEDRALVEAEVEVPGHHGDGFRLALVLVLGLGGSRRRSSTSMRFSVVIPARNEETLLPRLLDTVEAARRAYRGGAERVEVIVADNVSTDGTVEVARARGTRVVSVEKRVIGAVRNGGARDARGEILVFVDADIRIHLGRPRGQRLTRLRSAKAIASVRKFDAYGDWHYFRLTPAVALEMLRRGQKGSRFLDRYWYGDVR